MEKKLIDEVFTTTIGKIVRIWYSEPLSKSLEGTTSGVIENVGNGKVWIKNKNDCLECFSFTEIIQMIQLKK